MKDKSGFSLVEMLVVAGLMIATAIASLKMMEIRKKNQISEESKTAILSLHNEIQNYLGKTDVCKRSFEDKVLNVKVVSIDKILKNDGKVKYEVGGVFDNRLISIEAMKLLNLDLDASISKKYFEGTVSLKITYKKLKDTYSTKTISKEVNLFVLLDASKKIINCSPISSMFAEKVALQLDGAIPVSATNVNEDKVLKENKNTKNIQSEMIKIQNYFLDPKVGPKEKIQTLQKMIDENPELKPLQGLVNKLKKNLGQ